MNATACGPSAAQAISGRTELPVVIPQQTFMEAKAAGAALADGPNLLNWAPIEGELALRHYRDGANHEAKLTAGGSLLSWLGHPGSVAALAEEVRLAGLPAVMALHVCLDLALRELEVTITPDDLIKAIGWTPRSCSERQGMRRRVWRWLLIFDQMEIVGRRVRGRWTDAATGQVLDLSSRDALIRITGRVEATQRSFDDSAPPAEITFVAGAWLSGLRDRPDVLQYFGDLRHLASIPEGKAAGAWARSIGLGAQQFWRENAATATKSTSTGGNVGVRFRREVTREQLLGYFPPSTPAVLDVLFSANPRRAKTYFASAIRLLQSANVLGYYAEVGSIGESRTGWQRQWLEQRIDIRPSRDLGTNVLQIADKHMRRTHGRRARVTAGLAIG